MKILDIENMDKDEKELYQMLTSKFNETEMMKLIPLMVIDSEKYHQEKLNNDGVLDNVSKSSYCNDCGDWIGQGCDNKDCEYKK